jgi:XTP/dITP diphosphohydrolase
MRFVLASNNQHKAKEINAMLPRQFELVVQSDLGVDSPEETGSTFIENAIIKARHAAEVTGMPAIADDSGLCVDSLSGAPGVHSARFAGESATDEDNVNLLLQRLEGVSERSASFHCVLVCMRSAADPAPTIAAASWHGTIASQRTGMGGFGYDPVFVIKGQNRTAAELSAAEKNAISHRGLALKKLCDALIEQYSS